VIGPVGERLLGEPDPERRRRQLTVAAREQEILERWFPRTVAESSYTLPSTVRTLLAEEALPDRPYHSPVSKQLMTGIRERQLVLGLLACAFALGMLAMALRRRTRR
jgi:hypothetical protein